MIIEKKYRWVRIAKSSFELQFANNNLVEIEIEGKKICIARTTSSLKACFSKCPHASGDLAQGKIDKRGNIVCPVHGYIFNLNNGRDTMGEGYFLKIYPVKEDEEGVFVGIDEVFFEDK